MYSFCHTYSAGVCGKGKDATIVLHAWTHSLYRYGIYFSYISDTKASASLVARLKEIADLSRGEGKKKKSHLGIATTFFE